METKAKKDLFIDLVKELLRYHSTKECPIQHIIEEAETIIASMDKIGEPVVEIVEDNETRRYNNVLNTIKVVFAFDKTLSSQEFRNRYFRAIQKGELKDVSIDQIKNAALQLGIIKKPSLQQYELAAK